MHTPNSLQETSSSSAIEEGDSLSSEAPVLTVVPSIGALPAFRSSSSLTPVVCDERAIGGLLELIIVRGKLSIHEMARRLGVTPACVRQYVNGRRGNPSLKWFVRFANLAGAKVSVEFPER
jgi:hypothetical protein